MSETTFWLTILQLVLPAFYLGTATGAFLVARVFDRNESRWTHLLASGLWPILAVTLLVDAVRSDA